MTDPFAHSLRWLETDRLRGAAAAGICGVLVLMLWIAWALCFDVGIYITSETARVESQLTVHDVRSPLEGELASLRVALGSRVRDGEPLFELDREELELELGRLLAERRALARRLDPLQGRIEARTNALHSGARARRLRRDETATGRRAAILDAEHASDRAAVLEQLASRGVVATDAVRDADIDASLRRLEAKRLSQTLERMQEETGEGLAEAEAELEALRGEREAILGSIEVTDARIEQIEWTLSRLVVVAPISGVVGDLAEVSAGARIEKGESIVRIVPDGSLRVVSEFLPSASIGRVHPGQRGRLRVEGFEWTRFGTIPIRVERVGSEPHQGMIRVESRLLGYSGPIPLQHGLTGTMELEAERLTPLELVMRITGQLVDGG